MASYPYRGRAAAGTLTLRRHRWKRDCASSSKGVFPELRNTKC